MIPASIVSALLALAGPGDVVARVDGTTITVAAVSRRLRAAGPMANPDRILQTMIDEALLSAEGRRLRLESSPVALERFETLQRMAAGDVLLRTDVEGKANPDDETLRRMFHSTADFAAFEVLAYPTSEAAAAALQRIRKGASFASEAPRAVVSRLHADPKTAPLVVRAEIDAPVAAALFAADPGAIVGPIRLPEGFAVVRLLKKVTGSREEFEKKRAALATHARAQIVEQMKKHALAKLREKGHVKLDEAFLRSAEDVSPTGEQMEHVIASPGGKPLRYGDIFETVRAIKATGGHMGPSLRTAVAWQAVDSRLLQAAAVERGLLKSPEVVAMRPEHEAAAVGYAAMRRIVDETPPPSKGEVAAFYERNRAAFGRPLSAVKPQAAAGAAREKRDLAYAQALAALRKKATVSIDREALARAARPGA